MCPLFSHPRPLCIKSFFSEKISSRSRRQCSPTQAVVFVIPPPLPSILVKQDLWQTAPMCKFVCLGVQVGQRVGFCLPVPCKQGNFDRQLRGGKKKNQAWKPKMKKWAGKRINVRFSRGSWGHGCGKCFLSGVSFDRVQWRGVMHADKNNSPTIMLT